MPGSNVVRRMPNVSRPLFLFALVALLAACSGAPSGSPGTDGSPAASETPAVSGGNAIDHPTGATDVVLRYEEGGGFMMPAFIATMVPHFTLYGDGTVVFRDPRVEPPAAEGPVMRQNPFRTATLSEDQVQELLAFALGEGGLGVARPTYENPMIADASTAIFTIRAGGLDKTVSVYALGLDGEGVPDLPARAAFSKLAERLIGLDSGGAFPTDVYTPAAYRVILIDDGGFPGPGPMAWPFGDLTMDDFAIDPANPNQFPSRVMTAAELDALGLENYEGGLMGITVLGPGDGKSYTLGIRPLLPDETK